MSIVLQVVLFTVLWFKWSVRKHCVAKVLLAIWEIFLHENNRNYNSYRFSYKFAFILFLSFLTNQKQKSGFQQVGGLVTINISVFYLEWAALYFKAVANSIDFYKRIFLDVIPDRIIVPWCNPVKHKKRRFNQKQQAAFRSLSLSVKSSISDFWLGSKCLLQNSRKIILHIKDKT